MTSIYASTGDLKALIGRGVTIAGSNDETLSRVLSAASRQVDAYTGWFNHGFWLDDTVTVREYETDNPYSVEIPEGIGDTAGLIVKVDVALDGTFSTSLTVNTHFLLEPRNSIVDGRPYTEIRLTWITPSVFPQYSFGRPVVQVTAKFGWPAVPPEVKEATLLQAMMIFKSSDAPFGAAALGDSGIAMRVGSGLHPSAAGLVRPYTKAAVG